MMNKDYNRTRGLRNDEIAQDTSSLLIATKQIFTTIKPFEVIQTNSTNSTVNNLKLSGPTQLEAVNDSNEKKPQVILKSDIFKDFLDFEPVDMNKHERPNENNRKHNLKSGDHERLKSDQKRLSNKIVNK
jgi:hypothetical protein